MLSISDGRIVSGQSMLVVACYAIGALIGEIIDFENIFERFGEWLKAKSGNSSDSGFVDAFVTASLTVCVGAMGIMGSIMIFCIGMNLVFGKRIRVANLLPALVVVVIAALVQG